MPFDSDGELDSDRVPVIVNASQKGTIGGAAALMVAPTMGTGEALADHLRRIANCVDVPIVLQDDPAGSGIELTSAAIVDLIEEVPEIVCVKLESPPTGRRPAALLSRLGDRVTALGGLGGGYLADGLRHGTHGAITSRLPASPPATTCSSNGE